MNTSSASILRSPSTALLPKPRVQKATQKTVVKVGALPLIPIALGVGVAALLGYGLLSKSSSTKKSATSNTDDASARQNVFDMGHDAGCAQGSEDKKSGLANAPPASDSLSGVAKSTSPTDYYAGYLKGYADCYASGVATTYEATPSDKKPGMSAYDYGYQRGKSSGTNDYNDGYEASWETNLNSAGSKKRQAESGDPAQYRAGYKAGYVENYTAAAFGDATSVFSEGEGGTAVGTTVESSNTGPGFGRDIRVGQSLAAIAIPSFRRVAGPPGGWGRRQTALAAVNQNRVDRFSRVMGAAVGGVGSVVHAVAQGTVNVGCAACDEAVKTSKATVGLFFNTGRSVVSSDSVNPTYQTVARADRARTMPTGSNGYDYGYAKGRDDRANGRSFNPSYAAANSGLNQIQVRYGYQAGWNSVGASAAY